MKEAENSSLKWKWGMEMKKKILLLICALICMIGVTATLSLVMNQHTNISDESTQIESKQMEEAAVNETYIMSEEKVAELEKQVEMLVTIVGKLNDLLIYEHRMQALENNKITSEKFEKVEETAQLLAEINLIRNIIPVFTAEDIAANLYIKARIGEIMTGNMDFYMKFYQNQFYDNSSDKKMNPMIINVSERDENHIKYSYGTATIVQNNNFHYEMVPEALKYVSSIDYINPDRLRFSSDLMEAKQALDIIYSLNSSYFYEVREYKYSKGEITPMEHFKAYDAANSFFEDYDGLWSESATEIIYRILFGEKAYMGKYEKKSDVIVDGYGNIILNGIGW